MNSVHFATNGNTKPGTAAGQPLATIAEKPKVKDLISPENNLNWLLHKMYLIGDYTFCKKLIEQQMESTLNQEFLLHMKGKILREEGKFVDALKCFKKTIEYDSKHAGHYKEIGKTLYKLGKYNQSLEIFLKAESHLDAPDHEVYHFIAELLRLNAKHSKASLLDVKEYFRRSIMCGKQVQTYLTLANIYRKEKDYTKAVELLESSLSVAPGNVSILTDLGIMYLKINEVDRAYEKLQEALSYETRNSSCILAVGAIQQTRNDIDRALNSYKNMPGLENEGFEVWSNIGLCFYRKNKLIAAISCLKKALWLCPLNYNILYNLGIVYMTGQQFASAFQCFVSAVTLRPDSAESFMMLAICLYYLNDIENAQVSFRKSILSSDAIKNPLIYLNYSIFSLECLKNVEEAQQYLNNFYNLCETMNVPSEYMQIAENVLVKLPSSMLLPEIRHTELKDTRISNVMENENVLDENQENSEENLLKDDDLV